MIRLNRLVVVLGVAVVGVVLPWSVCAQGDPRGSAGSAGSNASGERGGGIAGTGGSGGSSGMSSGGTSGTSGGGSSSTWSGGGSSNSGGSNGSWSGSGGSGSRRQDGSGRREDGRQFSSGYSGGQSLQAFSRSRGEYSSANADGGRVYNSGGPVPWFTRPRGDNPTTGTAAGRTGTPQSPTTGSGWFPGYPGSGGYYDSYYYPGFAWSYFRDCNPVGFGAYGIGYFYYSPSWWQYGGYGCSGSYYRSGYGNPSSWYFGEDGMASGGYLYPLFDTSGYPGAGRATQFGESGIRLKVKPAMAQVFVDGYFAGQVDEFDGTFQKLMVTPGNHKLEIKAPGFEPLTVEVRVDPFQTITYKGELVKIQ